ncbi:flagellin-like protein [Azoarcus sp. CIB]|uniref:flagellin n=1 Tax=Aromatoleum sp. (strain CIB) TaxID=198107 RepID=UPI00067D02F9|nr:flagellin [Azoarcus sp. CIB]AKU10885.1 flagellin-like protein [Azoarcus sp. CIB]
MAQVINTNVSSLNAQRNLNTSGASLATSLQRLSSGLRINSAKDDAAGLAISERFGAQIRGLNQAVRNANDGISLAQTAEGALGEIGNNLQRIRELAVQSRNATNSADDRAALQKEVVQLKDEIDRVANQTSFNGTKLIDGSFQNQDFQVGADQGQTITVANIADANIAALGSWTSAVATSTTSGASGAFTTATSSAIGQAFTLTVDGTNAFTKTTTAAVETVTAAEVQTGVDAFITASAGAYTATGTVAGGDLVISKADGTDMTIALTNTFNTPGGFAGTMVGTATNGDAAGTTMTGFAGLDISSTAGADNAIVAMDAALKAVNGARADLGAIQNRFSSTIANLQTTSENLSASRSRILDADFAQETANLTRGQILQQAGTAMLAQANSLPNNVLSLLRG